MAGICRGQGRRIARLNCDIDTAKAISYNSGGGGHLHNKAPRSNCRAEGLENATFSVAASLMRSSVSFD